VEIECISYHFTLFAIFLPKIIRVGVNLTTLWQKQFFLFFLRQDVYIVSCGDCEDLYVCERINQPW